jgi:hypothetical protein
MCVEAAAGCNTMPVAMVEGFVPIADGKSNIDVSHTRTGLPAARWISMSLRMR